MKTKIFFSKKTARIWSIALCISILSVVSMQVNAQACAGAPAPGATTASATSVCPGTIVSFSLSNTNNGSNITYQWYNNGGAIAGATNLTYIATITSSDDFYCDVSCTNSALTTSSNIVSVTLGTCVNLKLFIEGYWDGTSAMHPVRMNQACPPPNGNNIAAEVTVALHSAIPPYLLLESQPATLMTDGTCTATFSATYTGSYFIAIKHCNILETWSAAPVNLSTLTSIAPYDFSTALSKAYDDDLSDGVACMKQISATPMWFAFLMGDLDQDGNIGLSDLILIQNDINNNLSGCLCSDLNGDGLVNQLDVSIAQTNFFQWMKRPY